MENFIKQMRTKSASSEPENKGDMGGSRDQKVSTQKTQSFKEKKKAQNWFQRQFIRKMSRDYDSKDLDHATAVAAAAYAISTQEVLETPHKISHPGGSKRFSGSFKFTDGQGRKEPTSPAIDSVPSKKKTRSFRELLGTKPDTTSPEIPPPIGQTSTKPATRETETEAEAWEKAELEKIKQKYDKLKETIDSWENKKRRKAKHKLNVQESELEQRRVKAMDKFRNEMHYIDQIARGAREQADARRRNEEFKVKEKANGIRTTGRLPGACSCF